jgi:hypothetical protein
MSLYIGREGEIRFIDSTAVPYYFAMLLENMDFKGPWGRPRPEEILVLDRENIDAAMHYIVNSERAIGEPVAVSFTARLDDANNRTKLRQVINAASADTSAGWTVGAHTWWSTQADYTWTDVDGNSYTCPTHADTRKGCVDVDVLWNSGATDIGVKYGAVYFDPGQQEIGEAEDAVSVTLNGMCLGSITEITTIGGTNPS